MLSVLVVGVLGTALWWWLSEPEPQPAAPTATASTPASPAAEPTHEATAAKGPVADAGRPEPRITLSGVVVDADGAPVRGAEVKLLESLSHAYPDVKCFEMMPIMARAMGRVGGLCNCNDSAAALEEAIASLAPPRVIERVVTDSKGGFTFEVPASRRAVVVHASKGDTEAAELAGTFSMPGLRLTLLPVRELTGTVVSEDGTVVEDATVAVLSELPFATKSDALGRFTVKVRPGPLPIAATKSGLLADLQLAGLVDRYAMGRPPRPFELRLGHPITVRGVVMSNGAPAAGADVAQISMPCTASTRTGADGTFALEGMRAQKFSFQASLGDQHGEREAFGAAPVIIELTAHGTLEGVVRDAAGQPVGQAQLRLRGPGRQEQGAMSMPGTGNYIVTPVPVGKRELEVSAPGYARFSRPVDIAGGHQVLDIDLPSGAPVRVHLTDDLGAPLANVWVTVHQEAVPEQSRPRVKDVSGMLTSAAGELALVGLPDGPYMLDLSSLGFTQPFSVPREGVLEVRVSRGGKISGAVQSARVPVKSAARVTAVVKLDDHGNVPHGTYSHETRVERGRYELSPLKRGSYEVTATLGRRTQKRDVVVREGESQAVDFDFGPARSISGYVRDEGGHAIAGAVIAVEPAPANARANEVLLRSMARFSVLRMRGAEQVVSGADGAFLVDDLEAADHVLLATRTGYTTLDLVSAKAPATGVVITVHATGVVKGRLLGVAGPLNRFTVNSEPQSDPQGRFEVDRGTPATGGSTSLKLTLAAEGYAATTRIVPLPPEGSVDVGDVTLARGRVITGRVVDAQGQGVQQAAVRCTADGAECGSSSTSRNGEFVIDQAATGAVVLNVSKRGLLPRAVPVATNESAVTVRLEAGFTLRGRVVDERKAPLPPMTLFFRGSAAVDQGITADVAADGTFAIGGLGAGELELETRISQPDSMLRVPKQKVQVTGDLEVVLRGTSAGARLKIVFVGPFASQARLSGLVVSGTDVRRPSRSGEFLSVPRGRHALEYVLAGEPVELPIEVTVEDELTMEINVDGP